MGSHDGDAFATQAGQAASLVASFCDVASGGSARARMKKRDQAYTNDGDTQAKLEERANRDAALQTHHSVRRALRALKVRKVGGETDARRTSAGESSPARRLRSMSAELPGVITAVTSPATSAAMSSPRICPTELDASARRAVARRASIVRWRKE